MPEPPRNPRPTGPAPHTPRPPLRQTLRAVPASALAAVAIGGAIGATARYGLTTALPSAPGSFNYATFLANTTGGLLIGALMVIVTEAAPGTTLARPFLGVGVLGGFTTFSTYLLDIGHAANADATLLAVLYAFTTLAAALLTAALGMYATRRLLKRGRRDSETT
ncbi:CrcB family protein [Glycomyces sp. TRM65418]|uniref:fluoride efflux transporter FluC n=1 Tax=Glycomyces sp. TRM65418 TaxID=2867006 RepID=UPI001CE4F311|nr:CrcB family protein [Glycomyces sp. TRM65418]MCC3764163.1 CrcB family protein [Glycomyces sp. TRM65418]QZD53848.1 CrcB family protein [Glycomyces sp. TRM65418]